MDFNLELFLVISTAITGAIVLFYKLFHGSKKAQDKRAWLFELAHSFFPILLFVLVFRFFLFEPFRIPSGSMLPTLEVGDFILVNKFSYGLKLPIVHLNFWENGKPKRGDIIVFRFPGEPTQNFIKRLIGLPGDRIDYYNKKLKINGEEIKLTTIEKNGGVDSTVENLTYAYEDLQSVNHMILLRDGRFGFDGTWEVPDGHYFVMGDNRDNSNDSRFWGFVPETHLVGRASLVWMNWNWIDGGFDFSRIGQRII